MLEQRNATNALRKSMKHFASLGKSHPEFMSSFDMKPLRKQVPAIDFPTIEAKNEYQSASVFMQALAESALEWKSNLPEGYTPSVLAVLYGGIQIHVNTMSQVSFNGIRIEGTMEGNPCLMLAHRSTVQVLCFGQKIMPDKPANPIGFVWQNNHVEV